MNFAADRFILWDKDHEIKAQTDMEIHIHTYILWERRQNRSGLGGENKNSNARRGPNPGDVVRRLISRGSILLVPIV
jgi:hypothetical protein